MCFFLKPDLLFHYRHPPISGVLRVRPLFNHQTSHVPTLAASSYRAGQRDRSCNAQDEKNEGVGNTLTTSHSNSIGSAGVPLRPPGFEKSGGGPIATLLVERRGGSFAQAPRVNTRKCYVSSRSSSHGTTIQSKSTS